MPASEFPNPLVKQVTDNTQAIATINSNLPSTGTMQTPSAVNCASGSFVTLDTFTPTDAGTHVYLIEATAILGEAGTADRNNIFLVDTAETNNNNAGNSVLVKGARAYIQKVRVLSLSTSDTVYFRAYQNSGSTVSCSVSYRITRLK